MKSNIITLIVISVIFLSLFLIFILFWVIQDQRWFSIGFGIALFYYIIFLGVLYFQLKNFKRDSQKIHEMTMKKDWEALITIMKEKTKGKLINYQLRKLATLALIDYDKTKALHHLTLQIEKEFENEQFENQYLSLLQYFNPEEDGELIYDYLFSAILILQKAYYSNKKLTITTSYPYNFYISNIVERAMIHLAKIFGFNYLSDFITYNILKVFQKILPELTPKEPVDISQIAQISRATEEKITTVLKKLLETYPQLGHLKEFKMEFTPTKDIIRFEEIVNIHSIIFSEG